MILCPFHLTVAAGEDDIVGVAGCPVAGPLRTRLLEVLLEVRRVGQAGRDIGNINFQMRLLLCPSVLSDRLLLVSLLCAFYMGSLI